MKKTFTKLFSLSLFLTFAFHGFGQSLNIIYPTPSQSLQRSFDTSELHVKVAFPVDLLGAPNGLTNLSIQLPPTISYVPNSVVKIGVSNGDLFIAEHDISNLNNPIFRVGKNLSANGNIFAGNDIEFKIKRWADCGILLNGKDKITVFHTSGFTFADTSNVTNGYNIGAAVLNFNIPSAFNNGSVGTITTKNYTLVNGGQGCADTVLLGIHNNPSQSQIVSLRVNGVALTPAYTIADTAFYQIFGTTLHPTQKLCNSQTISVEERLRVLVCNPVTNYVSTWGKPSGGCDRKTTSSVVNMSEGQISPAVTETVIQPPSECRNGSKNVQLRNNGSGGVSGAMFNIKVRYWYSPSGYGLPGPIYVSSMSFVNTGTPITYSIVPNQFYEIDFRNLTSDPDGAGGLEDIDGDGRFDDLMPNSFVNIRINEIWNCNNTSIVNYNTMPRMNVDYTTQCSSVIPVTSGQIYTIDAHHDYFNVLGVSLTGPNQVFGYAAGSTGDDFTININSSVSANLPRYKPSDSLHLQIIMPPGASLIPGTGFQGSLNLTSQITQIGQIINVATTSANWFNFRFSFRYLCSNVDITNTCFKIKMNYYPDASCLCKDSIFYDSICVEPVCPNPCEFVNSFVPLIQRTTTGFTNYSMAANVPASSLSADARIRFLGTDNFRITARAKQGGLVNRSALYYRIELDKTPPIGGNPAENILEFNSNFGFGGTLFVRRGSTTLSKSLPFPFDFSTTSTQILSWNLISVGNSGSPPFLFPGGVVQPEDSVWIIANFRIRKVNGYSFDDNRLQKVKNSRAFFHNSTITETCVIPRPEYYIVGFKEDLVFEAKPLLRNGCNPEMIEVDFKTWYKDGLDLFPNEYRPGVSVDSIRFTPAPGIEFDFSAASKIRFDTWNGLYTVTKDSFPVTAVNVPPRAVFINQGYGNTNGWPRADIEGYNYEHEKLIFPIKYNCNWNSLSGSLGTIQVHYKDAAFNPSQSNTQTPRLVAINVPAAFIPPNKTKITATNITGVVEGLYKQGKWDIQFSNTSQYVPQHWWFAIDNATSGLITIDSVVNLNESLVVNPSGSNSSRRWYYLDGIQNLLAAQPITYRIYFKYNTCNLDSVRIRYGWDCKSFSNTTDPTVAGCIDGSLFASVKPVQAKLQLFMDRHPRFPSVAMCANDTFEVIYNSAEKASVYNGKVAVQFIPGFQLSPTFEIEYPRNSGNWLTGTGTVAGGLYIYDLNVHNIISQNGLPGTALSSDTIPRQARIRFFYKTECSFISGQKMVIFGFGNSPCGDVAVGNGDYIFSNPIRIQGADPGGAAGAEITLPSPVISCTPQTINIKTTPTLLPYSSEDTLLIRIQKGIRVSGVTNVYCPPTPINPSVDCSDILPNIIIDNSHPLFTSIKVKLPEGLTPGELFSVDVEIYADSFATCGTYSMFAQAVRAVSSVRCVTTNTDCPASLSLLGEDVKIISVFKPNLIINNFSLSATNVNIGQTYQYTYQISNTSSIPMPAGTILEIMCTGSNVPIGTITLPAIPANSFINSSPGATVTLVGPGIGCLQAQAITARIKRITHAGNYQCLCNDVVTSPFAYLPITEAKLNGFALKNENKLYFSFKYDQVSISNIIIEKSEFSDKNFKVIKEYNFSGLANIPNSIEYTDMQLVAPTNYYRVKIVAANGEIKYSNTISLNQKQVNKIVVYPVPVFGSGTSFVETYLEQTLPIDIKIININGEIINSIKANGKKGLNKIQLPISNLTPGTYQVLLSSGNFIGSAKLVVLR